MFFFEGFHQSKNINKSMAGMAVPIFETGESWDPLGGILCVWPPWLCWKKHGLGLNHSPVDPKFGRFLSRFFEIFSCMALSEITKSHFNHWLSWFITMFPFKITNLGVYSILKRTHVRIIAICSKQSKSSSFPHNWIPSFGSRSWSNPADFPFGAELVRIGHQNLDAYITKNMIDIWYMIDIYIYIYIPIFFWFIS